MYYHISGGPCPWTKGYLMQFNDIPKNLCVCAWRVGGAADARGEEREAGAGK